MKTRDRVQCASMLPRMALLGMGIGGIASIPGCASSPPDLSANEPTSCKTSGDTSHGGCLIQITPLSSLKTSFDDPNEAYSNLYTRILVNGRGTRDRDVEAPSSTTTGIDSRYDYRDRGALLRELWGTHYSINLTAYLTIGAYKATVPLVTIDHVSDRNSGEKFQRVVAHTVQNFPLVLIKGDGSNAVATVKFVVKASDDPQSNVAALAIQAAEGVAKAVAPESTVVTTLSSQASRDKATALDNAINTLMSKQLDEEQLIDNDVRRWGRGVLISFRIPPPNSESSWSHSENFRTVGSWRVQFEDPRPSIFSDIQICFKHVDDASDTTQPSNKKVDQAYCRSTVADASDAAQKDAAGRPEQVLAFSLVNGSQNLGSVLTYLKQQSFWDASNKTFNALRGEEAPKSDDVSSFCRSVKSTLANIGLNAVDGGIVTAAVRERAQLSAAVTKAMKANDDCGYAKSIL
jgi:hypothetical protein